MVTNIPQQAMIKNLKSGISFTKCQAPAFCILTHIQNLTAPWIYKTGIYWINSPLTLSVLPVIWDWVRRLREMVMAGKLLSSSLFVLPEILPTM